MQSHCYRGVMPRHADPEQRRREIALGVIHVMIQHGIEAVSLRRVADAAGVSMGRVQHYFATKDDLLVHACLTITELAEDRYIKGDTDPRARLRHLLMQAIPTNDIGIAALSAWYMFITAAVAHPRVAAVIREAWTSLHDEITSLTYELGDTSPETTANLLAAVLDGICLRVINGALSPAEARSVLDRSLDRLLPGECGLAQTPR
ncbi:TetR family transcriptional regulator [Propioniferax innocua]|uniref:TetR family transcriptional regulator n=2 Tax=Propioniferax innocua TaxID=1753 RepID=A0A542ZQP6_9ACTN|nr:TetR family transcriptional regulator [Propioniferax innocua]